MGRPGPRVTETHSYQELLDVPGRAGDVHIETRRDGPSPAHDTLIRAVFVCPVRGGKGRPYREASANPEAALRTDDRRIRVRAVHETDGATIGKVGEACREKYEASHPDPTAATVREGALPTTLRRSLPA